MRCFVPGCKNGDRNKPEGVSFHKIPQVLKQEWLRAINRDENVFIINQKICSEHFHRSDFYFGKLKILKPNVIPHLKLPEIKLVEKTEDIKVELYDDIIDEPQPSCSKETDTSQPRKIVGVKRSLRFSMETEKSEENDAVERIVRHGSTSSSKSTSTSASIKRERKKIKTFHNYSLSPDNYKKQILCHKTKVASYRERLKRVKRTSMRRVQKICSLKEIVATLEKKRLLSSAALEQLECCFSGIPQLLMRRMLKINRRGKLIREGYPPELKSFAMTLQFYSDKAYRYVRKVFDLALPAESTIRAWLSKVDCEPGFSKPSITALKIKAEQHLREHNKPLLCSLMLDEMAIKKNITVEPATLKTRGYVDFGCGDIVNEDECELATESLVLMVVGVNCSFKLPIAYFFINKLNGKEKANVVREALKQLHPTGARILGLTCDGPKVNFKMMVELGCAVTNMHHIVPFFKHPVDNINIYIFFDVCHMLKLIRNNWQQLSQFKDPDGNVIDWTFIIKLHELQEKEGLLLGNKLRKKHIEFRKAIMKVNLAAQTLSSSVADALEFLKSDINLPEFQNVGPTIKFIRIIDGLFDILNSRNPYARGYKTALKTANERYWRPFLDNAIDYLKRCTRLDSKPMVETSQKTPFIGLIISALSSLNLFDREVKEFNNLKYLLTYKFSQDHLELFFCSIRSRNGWIVNPTCLQFIKTYRRLLVHNDLRDDQGNCVAQDQTKILTFTSTKELVDETDIFYQRQTSSAGEGFHQEIDETEYPAFPLNLNEFAENVVAYIAGYVIRMYRRQSKCTDCLQALIDDGERDDTSLKFLKRKSHGGLLLPSYDLRQLCFKVEKKITLMCHMNNDRIPNKSTAIYLLMKDVNDIYEKGSIFKMLDNHVLNQEILAVPHKKKLIEFVVRSYAKIRLNSLAKKMNESLCGVTRRSELSRLIIFRNE